MSSYLFLEKGTKTDKKKRVKYAESVRDEWKKKEWYFTINTIHSWMQIAQNRYWRKLIEGVNNMRLKNASDLYYLQKRVDSPREREEVRYSKTIAAMERIAWFLNR